MNKIRFGHSEYTIIMWFLGIIPLVICLILGMPLVYMIFIFFSMMMTGIAAGWMPYLVNKYQLRPGIDKCHDNETTWFRFTKDHLFVPQFVERGPYGQTKGVTHREKADQIDDGAFPVKWKNGNPGIIVYDLMNTSVDLNKSVARKLMKKRHGIRSGIEAYNKAKAEGEVLFSE